LRVQVVLRGDRLPAWIGDARRRRLRTSLARAGVELGLTPTDPASFRPVDLSGYRGVAAVIAAAEAQLGWPYLLGGQSRAEGGFDPAAVSSAGAQGAAQFLPSTWTGSWNPYREHSPFEPRYAVLAQARYLANLLARSAGDVPRALAAYNAGWAGSERGWPAE